MLHPVGSLPPHVYWRRRIMLGGLLAAVVLAVLTAYVLAGQQQRTPRTPARPTPGPSTSASAPVQSGSSSAASSPAGTSSSASAPTSSAAASSTCRRLAAARRRPASGSADRGRRLVRADLQGRGRARPDAAGDQQRPGQLHPGSGRLAGRAARLQRRRPGLGQPRLPDPAGHRRQDAGGRHHGRRADHLVGPVVAAGLRRHPAAGRRRHLHAVPVPGRRAGHSAQFAIT